MNHNIINKITEEYIAERVSKAIREHDDKIYIYILYIGCEGMLHYSEIPPKIISADNKKELLIKIFYENYKLFEDDFMSEHVTHHEDESSINLIEDKSMIYLFMKERCNLGDTDHFKSDYYLLDIIKMV